MKRPLASQEKPYLRWIAFCLAALLAVRIILLMASPFGLHGDEAQYWAWAQNLDWGYFSKPPMIAWVIAAFTAVLGDAEWAVRLASPLFHTGTSALIFLTGRRLFSAKIGFWGSTTYALMPAVWLSSMIISTDAVLLFFWALALHAWATLRDDPTWPRAMQLGLAIGLGLMSKYAMAFFLPGLFTAVLLDPPTRRALISSKGLAIGVIAALCLAPNLLWNAQNSFATISHTAQNTNLERDLFHPLELLGFWGAQLGVFGPISFLILIASILATAQRQITKPALCLAVFAAVPLVLISLQALLSRANANWAVSAYVAAPILAAVWALAKPKRLVWLKAGLAAQTVVVAALGTLILMPDLQNPSSAARWLNSEKVNAVKRVKAWPETAAAIQDVFAAGHEGQPYSVMATDNRRVFYSLQYYGLDPLFMWKRNAQPGHHAELTAGLTTTKGPILLINYFEDYAPNFTQDFETLKALPPIDIDLGGGKRRQLRLWAGTGYVPYQGNDRG